MNKTEFVAAIAAKAGLSKKDAERILFSHRFDYKWSKGPLKR